MGALGFGLLVVWLAGEIVLRALYSHEEAAVWTTPHEPSEAGRWTDHPFLPFIGKPNARYVVSGAIDGIRVEGRVENNSTGFRTHEIPDAKPPGAYFIVTLGGSTTWGALAESNDDTWPALLEGELRRRYPERDIRVFNLGTQNVTLPYSVTALALNAAALEPDLVIVYHGFNDFGPSMARGYRSDHAHYFRDLLMGHRWHGVQRSLPTWLLSSYAVGYVSVLADAVIGANALSFYVQRPVTNDVLVVTSEAKTRRALTNNWRHLLTIDALARGYGGRALFSTFQFFDGDHRNHRLVNETLRAFFDRHALAYVDQDAAIADRDRTMQFDECHFTRAGRQVVAENFLREILARGWLDGSGEDP